MRGVNFGNCAALRYASVTNFSRSETDCIARNSSSGVYHEVYAYESFMLVRLLVSNKIFNSHVVSKSVAHIAFVCACGYTSVCMFAQNVCVFFYALVWENIPCNASWNL